MTTAPISRKSMHRKPPAKRLFSGMVGSPLAKVLEAAPVETPEPAQAPPAATTVVGPHMGIPTITVLLEPDAETIERAKQIKKQMRAQSARDRRKRNAEQLASIKEKLKTPIAEIKKAAEEQTKLDKQGQARASMKRGLFLTDAPVGKGKLVNGGYNSEQMELVTAARGRAAALGSPDYEQLGIPKSASDPAFWPENDRGRVVPEGRGQRPGDREDDEGEDEGPDSTDDARDNKDERGGSAPILPGSTFQVKLNDGKQDQKEHDYDLLMGMLVARYCVKTKVFKNEFFYCASCGAKQPRTESIQTCARCEAKNGEDNGYLHVCRLCRSECDGFIAAKQHIDRVHGSENHPEHDDRFGDLTRRRRHQVTA